MADAIDLKELVRARTDLVALVSESVALQPRRGGAEYVGLCPFHNDHNPSLHIYPDRQSYRCWVCDAGGDAFSFVMKHENVTFAEALELLRERARIDKPQQSGQLRSGGGSIDKPRLFDVLSWADRQYRGCLKSAPEAEAARRYVAKRNISPEMVEKFGLGYVPRDWQWLLGRARGLYTARDLQLAGLANDRRDGEGKIDFFVDRLMFPIRDERGRVVSFGGRVLPGATQQATQKYLNGKESPVFPKSKLVYGLDLARDTIKQRKTAIVMEGYTDVIAAHQAGFTNVVATLGTALAETHVTLLRRFAETVVLVYDGDQAGISAAERALARFLVQDVDLRILTLPEGLDPADYLANDGKVGFESLVSQASPALEFKLGSAISRFDLNTEYGQSRVVQDVLSLVASAVKLAGTPRESAILRKVADRLGLREQTLRDELKRLRTQASSTSRAPQFQQSDVPAAGRGASPTTQTRSGPAHSGQTRSAETRPVRPDDSAEWEMLSCLLLRPDLFAWASQKIGPDDFVTPRLRNLFEHCSDVADMRGIPAYDLLMSCSDDPDLKQLLVALDSEARRKGLSEQVGSYEPILPEAYGDSTADSDSGSIGSDLPPERTIPPANVANAKRFLQNEQSLPERDSDQFASAGFGPDETSPDEASDEPDFESVRAIEDDGDFEDGDFEDGDFEDGHSEDRDSEDRDSEEEFDREPERLIGDPEQGDERDRFSASGRGDPAGEHSLADQATESERRNFVRDADEDRASFMRNGALGWDAETGPSAGQEPQPARTTGRDAEPGAIPRLVRDVVAALIRRRQSRHLKRSGGQLARQLSAGKPLDEDAKDLLRKFQQQLAARHAP